MSTPALLEILRAMLKAGLDAVDQALAPPPRIVDRSEELCETCNHPKHMHEFGEKSCADGYPRRTCPCTAFCRPRRTVKRDTCTCGHFAAAHSGELPLRCTLCSCTNLTVYL